MEMESIIKGQNREIVMKIAPVQLNIYSGYFLQLLETSIKLNTRPKITNELIIKYI